MSLSHLGTFRKTFTGQVITPQDARYKKVRNTYSHQGRPAVIARPRTSQDVALAIRFARENGLTFSVRSGGHGGAGFGTNIGGFVLDLCFLSEIEVLDQKSGRVRIGSGALWGDVAVKLEKYGLGISSGDTKSVGVGGLTLGGGIGWMVRKYGLALDSVVAAEIVTADGEILQLSATENADLFWAIRGGGGNFGVVTRFEFHAHQIHDVVTSTFIYGSENLEKILIGWRNTLRAASEDLTSTLLVMPAMGENPPSIIIMNCFAGSDETVAGKAFAPLLELGEVKTKVITKKKYSEVLEEAHKPQGMKVLTHNVFVDDLSDDLVAKLSRHHGKATGPMLMLRSLGGAMSRVGRLETAFAHRTAEALVVSVAFLPEDASSSPAESLQRLWDELDAHACGAYVNFFTEPNDADCARAYSGETVQKLLTLKKKYDPLSVFSQAYGFISVAL